MLSAGLTSDDIQDLGVDELDGWLDAIRIRKIDRKLDNWEAMAMAMAGNKSQKLVGGLIFEKEILLGNPHPMEPTKEAIADTKTKLKREREEWEKAKRDRGIKVAK